jgi:uncharacterized ferritin-like protein (DUF455 family)
MSIRQWAQKVLSCADIIQKHEYLSKALSNINDLPIGNKEDLSWSMPLIIEKDKSLIPPEVRMLTSIGQIEFMAINMYWDTISIVEEPRDFIKDMAEIALEESVHLGLIIERINQLGFKFSLLPFNMFLKDYSDLSKHSITSRLLVTSLYSEGRALDSHERLIRKFKGYSADKSSAALLEKIINDEVGHLRNGIRWFIYFCETQGLDPKVHHDQIMKEIGLTYRPPFNFDLRDKANVPREWYIK